MAFLSVFLFAGLLAAQGRYQKWLKEDVVYIITAAERQAFQHLNTGAERDRFIDQFWSRRNPAPTDPLNPLKEEHYRRIVRQRTFCSRRARLEVRSRPRLHCLRASG